MNVVLGALLAGLLAAGAVLTPAPIGGDVAGPGRGQYLWYPTDHPTGVPGTVTATDSYARYGWREIEPAAGTLNTAAIDTELARAKARGGRFSFRIMPVCAWCGLPDALPADVSAFPTSWTATLSDGQTVRVPDWNDPAYLARWDSLLAALGQRYGSDPRLGSIDVGGYGNWGEGHNWPYEDAYPRSEGQREASLASMTAIVRSVVRHFPSTFVAVNPLQLKQDGHGAIDAALSWSGLKAALTMSTKVGLRNDCLGGGSVQQSAVDLLNDAQQRASAEGLPLTDRPLDRWRIAPFVTEWCNNISPAGTDGSFAQGAGQVRSWHVSLVSNGNFQGSYADYSASEQGAFDQATREAGYRYSVVSVNLAAVVRGKDTGATVVWTNTAVAPTYQPWSVSYGVRDSTGRSRGVVAAGVRLPELLGGGATATDSIVLPTAGLPRGKYTLVALVVDPTGYAPPLRLASGKRLADGAYALGAVTVG